MPLRHQNTKDHKVAFTKVSSETERIARYIVHSAYNVHKKLGPGLLEKVYEICFCYELEKSGLQYQR